VVVELAVVPHDTTPPRLTRGEPRDSLQVHLFTDDYLDPTAQVGLAQVRILELPDSVEVPGPNALMTVDSFNALPRPEPDTTAPDSVAAKDSVTAADPVGADSLARRQPPRLGQALPPGRASAAAPRGPFGTPTGPLPYQEFVLVPVRPLKPGTKYLIEVRGLTNISARSSGGGEVEITMPEAKPPPPDTSGVGPRPGNPGR
jgi:hypothetical protein